MVARLTVIFFIILCLLAGFVLVVFPWISVGRVGDWGDNQLLVFLSQKLQVQSLQSIVASGWVRGAVTGLGVVNLIIGFGRWLISNKVLKGLKEKREKVHGERKKVPNLFDYRWHARFSKLCFKISANYCIN
ncbi:MAG: hypothetical protein HC846_12280 [Blastocatellia bacterium]|nr:hypothetical protein [Blastocatellia bacterium]